MLSASGASFFRVLEDGAFVANDGARGPWAADACHAGPVAGLIARSLEQAVFGKQLTRLTIDIVRPVPVAGFRIRTEVEREGRTLANSRAQLFDLNGRVCCMAAGVHLAVHEYDGIPSPKAPPPSFADRTPGVFPVQMVAHDQPCFPHAVQVAYPPGETSDIGPTTLWLKSPPLLDEEPMSPFQRLCPLADCGNGISRNAEATDMLFMNADLTIVMHRAPVGDWLASSAVSFWEQTGVGLAQAILFDTEGQVAVASQTLVVSPRG